jgi:hypothetical protein
MLASIENNFFYISTSRMIPWNEKAGKETEKCQVAEFADWILNTGNGRNHQKARN